MARKKKKDNLSELLMAVLMLSSAITFVYTQSLTATVAVLAVGFVGMLAIVKTLQNNKQKKLNESGILQVDAMSGAEFEEFLRLRYKAEGYAVRKTPYTGDYGADLILEKGPQKIAVQAKRYKSNVGIKAVQEISAAKLHYGANEAWVVTNSFFTKAAAELARSNKVKLVNRDELVEILLAKKVG
ncbi:MULTISPECIES: restriction endonuclease [Planococcus]|uniref:Restriction endonuclease n=1 Tax=Planococcus faecalis TaxID=1598147 RepID=A0ABN4XNC9_9BACL|nr:MULTISPECIES: restriction endonuclease [Planococcus]AQU78499.1 restriction endonuclease [Planococcus faecalis]MDJ0331538.1 restriction endonuclease [Planococcus sp. S3-L1]OHX51495.1 EcoKMrr [Planococcus faecalis]